MEGVVVEEVHEGHHHRPLEGIPLLTIGEAIGHHRGNQLLI